jgi:hypothetical protein
MYTPASQGVYCITMDTQKGSAVAAAGEDTIKDRIFNVVVVGLVGLGAFLLGSACIAVGQAIVMVFLLFSVYGPDRWPSEEVLIAIPALAGLAVGVASMVFFHVRRSSRKPPPPSAPQG